jgi:histone H3/H4
MTMSRSYCSTHKRLNTATYAETQRRSKFITLFNVDFNVNFNVDSNSNLDFDESNSNFFFAHFVFTSFLIRVISSRIHIISFENLHDKKSFSDKKLSSDKKLFDDKKLSRKIYKVKNKKKIIHVVNKFYDNFYDNFLTMLCFVNLIINKTFREIKTLQRVTNLFMFRLFFQKMMKNIMRDQTTKDLRIQRNVVNAFQKTIEEFLVKIFESKLILYIIWYII